MSFEQYQFLRYYLPGSLFLLYFTLLLIPFVDWKVLRDFMGGNFLALVTLVSAAFVGSPALGYLLYCFYDPNAYNKRFMDWRERPSLRLVVEWASEYPPTVISEVLHVAKSSPSSSLERKLGEKVCLSRLQPSLKSAIDSLIHSKPSGENLQISSGAADNLRGYWSHYAARFVCGWVAPLIASVLFLVVLIFTVVIAPWIPGIPGEGPIFAFQTALLPWVWFLAQFAIIWAVSVRLYRDKEYPRSEAFELEYDMICSIIVRQTATTNLTRKWNWQVEYVSLRKNLNKRIREAQMAYRICSDIRSRRNPREPIDTLISNMNAESQLTFRDLQALYEEVVDRIGNITSSSIRNRANEYRNWFSSHQEERRT